MLSGGGHISAGASEASAVAAMEGCQQQQPHRHQQLHGCIFPALSPLPPTAQPSISLLSQLVACSKPNLPSTPNSVWASASGMNCRLGPASCGVAPAAQMLHSPSTTAGELSICLLFGNRACSQGVVIIVLGLQKLVEGIKR